MNWFKKISQAIPPTYVGVGHGYEWNQEEKRYKEMWETGKSMQSLLWHYNGREIVSEPRTSQNKAHWIEEPHFSQGRIDVKSKTGSIAFNVMATDYHKKDTIEKLIEKFPDIRFFIYDKGGPYTAQEYFEKL